MSSSSSKKFKPVKGKAVEDTEEFSYDDVDVSRNDRSNSKRKSVGSVSSVNTSAKKKRTSNVSTTSSKSTASSKSKTAVVTKHHYPAVAYELSEELATATKGSTPHHTLLNELLEGIVSEERSALNSFAQSAQAKAIHGKKYIFESLDDVLNGLVLEVNQSLQQDVHFEPELSKAERVELKALLDTQRALQEHSKKLEVYEGDVNKLVRDHDLWLGSQVVAEKLANIPKNARSVSETETQSHYQALLTALEHHCSTLITSMQEAEGEVQQAKQVNDRLFDTFNKARVEAAHPKAPKDAKEILKKMPAFF